MKERLRDISPLLSIIGLLAVLVGTILPLFLGLGNTIAAYCYAVGAFTLLFARIVGTNPATDTQLRRLKRMELWVAIIFCVGAFFLFYPHGTFQDTLAFTLAGGILQTYVIIRSSLIANRHKSSDLQN